MSIEQIIIEQIESISHQEKALSSGKPDDAAFLHNANILLTIDRYIKELANLDCAKSSDIKKLQETWEQLIQNVKIVPPKIK